MRIAFGPDGLVPTIALDRLTGEIRMLAWASAPAVDATLRTRRATFFSRSRNELWEKGTTSGNALRVERVVADCDADALVYLVDPTGPTCHTGAESCFFRDVGPDGEATEGGSAALPELSRLERTIAARKASTAAASYTRSLLDGGAPMIGDKLREEADELARAVAGESDARVASEAADLLYHLMVALASRGVPLRDVLAMLAARARTSGHEEKASRR